MRAFVNNEIGRTEVMDKCPFQPTLFWGHPLITDYRWQLEAGCSAARWRSGLRARNGIRLAAGARSGIGCTPKDVVWRRGRTELWHYCNDDVRVNPPLLIVFSLISRSYILDLSPGNSFVEHLLKSGFDVWLLDWGVPDERDAQNRLEDYVDAYLPAGITRILELTGCDEVNLLGYCFGGDLALLHAAHHPGSPLRSLTVMATPVDFRYLGPLADVFGVGGLDVTDPEKVRSLAAVARDRWLAVDDRVPEHFTVTGYLAVRRLPGWSDHVGQIRLVVHPAHRRAGLGRTLARHALIQAVEAGLRKLVVELVADQEHAIGMFAALGFTGEALLRDHIRDRDGQLRDLVVLAHYVEETWAAMATVGLQEEMDA